MWAGFAPTGVKSVSRGWKLLAKESGCEWRENLLSECLDSQHTKIQKCHLTDLIGCFPLQAGKRPSGIHFRSSLTQAVLIRYYESMFIKETRFKRKSGRIVTYLQLVNTVWDKEKKTPRHKVLCSLGRKDKLDKDKLKNLISKLASYLDAPESTAEDLVKEARQTAENRFAAQRAVYEKRIDDLTAENERQSEALKPFAAFNELVEELRQWYPERGNEFPMTARSNTLRTRKFTLKYGDFRRAQKAFDGC